MIVEKRIHDFEKLGLGLFVHFGLYSMLGAGEWAQSFRKIDKDEYALLKDKFTAEKFDADWLVSTAKKLGFKYITLTTRHHDGFSLYDTSSLNDFNSLSAPCGRDLIKEFATACHKYDILPIFYHTTIDWHNELYCSGSDEDFVKYLEYLRQSVELLCTNYGKVGGFWFDGNWAKPNSDWKEDELYATIRSHQPDAMIINNTGLSARGELGNIELDSVTFERGKPTPINQPWSKKYLASEMCQILNSHWGYAKRDINYKSVKDIISELTYCKKCGSNYLLNVGPCGDGSIKMYDMCMLNAVGDWMNIYGESIYSTYKTSIESALGDYVVKGATCDYLFVSDLFVLGDSNVTVAKESAKKVILNGLTAKVKSVYWLDNNEELDFTQAENTLTVTATNFNYGEDLVVRVAKILYD